MVSQREPLVHRRRLDLAGQQLGQEAGRPLLGVLPAHRGDDEPAAGAGDGHVEQPPLLGEHLGDERGRGRGGAGAAPGRRVGGPARGDLDRRPAGELDQLLDAEQRAAQPQVGPDALLHARDHDHVPLQALGAVRGEDAHRLALGGVLGERVAGDLLGGQVVEEHLHARPWACGRRTGRPGRTAPPPRRGRGRPGRPRAPPREAQLGPPLGEAARLPDVPQHLLGAGAARRSPRGRWRCSRATRSGGRDHVLARPGRHGDQLALVAERGDEQLARAAAAGRRRTPPARRRAARGAAGARRSRRCRRAGR